MPKCKDIAGQRFGRLVAIEISHTDSNRKAYWRCRCDCGTVKSIWLCNLSLNTRSCGCLRNEVVAARSTTHAYASNGRKPSEYVTWERMISRCTNPNNIGFKDYGGAGVTVCAEWLESFVSFLSDMGPKPGKGFSIDRIDGRKGYEPVNCRWATAREQAENRKTSIIVDGLPLRRYCEKYNLSYGAMRQRLFREKHKTNAKSKSEILHAIGQRPSCRHSIER